jgi:hypothetical protein
VKTDSLRSRSDLLLFAQCPRCAWPKFIHEAAASVRCDNPSCRTEIERRDFQPYERLTRPPAMRA